MMHGPIHIKNVRYCFIKTNSVVLTLFGHLSVHTQHDKDEWCIYELFVVNAPKSHR